MKLFFFESRRKTYELKEGYRLTSTGKKKVASFIRELKAKRKEILDAGKDTADYTTLPTISDIEEDIEFTGIDDEGEYYNGWGVTDNYESDYPLSLMLGVDFVEAKTRKINEGRNAESITEEVWDNTTSEALSNAFDRDLLSIFRDGGVFWIESRGCPDREYKIAIRETKRIFPNLEYLYDLPTSRNDNYALIG